MSSSLKRFLLISALCLLGALGLVCITFLLLQTVYGDDQSNVDNSLKKAQNA